MLKKDTQEEHNVVTEADFGLQMLQLWTNGHHQKLGRGQEGRYPETQREQNPDKTLISDFWHLQL